MMSNLIAMDERMAQLIRDYRTLVGTSIDGDEAMCDAQRGPGYYAANERAEGRCCCNWRGGQPHLHVYARIRRRGGARIPALRRQSAQRNSLCFARRGTRAWPRAGCVYCDGGGYDAHSAGHPERSKQNMRQTRVSTLDSMARVLFDEEGHTCTFFPCSGGSRRSRRTAVSIHASASAGMRNSRWET